MKLGSDGEDGFVERLRRSLSRPCRTADSLRPELAESTLIRAFPCCALLPLSALENLREKSCEDVHDSVCW